MSMLCCNNHRINKQIAPFFIETSLNFLFLTHVVILLASNKILKIEILLYNQLVWPTYSKAKIVSFINKFPKENTIDDNEYPI